MTSTTDRSTADGTLMMVVAIPCEKAWGLSIKEKSRIAAMIEKERLEARQRRGSYEW